MDRVTALLRTITPIMERAGFTSTTTEPTDEALPVELRLSIMDTLLKRLPMWTGDGPPILPIDTDAAQGERLEWFEIVMQTCGEAGTFFDRRRAGEEKAGIEAGQGRPR